MKRKALSVSQTSYSTSIAFASTPYETLLNSITKAPPTSISRLRNIHALITTHGLSSKSVLACRLIAAYSSLSGFEDAHKLFDVLPKRTTHIYNYMLKAFVDSNQHQSVLGLYSDMLLEEEALPDPVTFSIVIKACITSGLLREGRIVHARVVVSGCNSDVRLGTDLLCFYLKCGCLDYAKKLFGLVAVRDGFVWTAMIDGLLRLGAHEDALKVFRGMRRSGLKVCSVTWNALISGLAREGLFNDTLRNLKLMLLDGVRPGEVVLSSVLPLFAQDALLKPGLEVHAYAIRNGLSFDEFVASALIDMYGKCGKLSLARTLFDRAEVRDSGLWNSIIVGYGMHGKCMEALSLFNGMIDAGVRPNDITFTAILSACSHGGSVSEGRRVFNLMTNDHKIAARHEHYACMVDLLGRAGLLDEAYEFIKKMPMEPTKDIWGAFLSACRIHSNVKFMEIAGKCLVETSNDYIGGYNVMMSNMYAESGNWGEMAKVRAQMRDGRMKKRTGCSWLEIGGSVHVFSMADFSHPRSKEMFFLLRNLNDDISMPRRPVAAGDAGSANAAAAAVAVAAAAAACAAVAAAAVPGCCPTTGWQRRPRGRPGCPSRHCCPRGSRTCRRTANGAGFVTRIIAHGTRSDTRRDAHTRVHWALLVAVCV